MNLAMQIHRTKTILAVNKSRPMRKAIQKDLVRMMLKQLRKENRQDKRA